MKRFLRWLVFCGVCLGLPVGLAVYEREKRHKVMDRVRDTEARVKKLEEWRGYTFDWLQTTDAEVDVLRVRLWETRHEVERMEREKEQQEGQGESG